MDWLWGALVGVAGTAIVGALSFLFKIFIFDRWIRARDERQRQIRALRDLQSLLAVSFDAFVNQNFKAQMLLASIEERHKEIIDANGNKLGYDEVFHNAYHVLTNDEKDLFQLIRGTTMATMRDVNSKMQMWIEDHLEFVDSTQPSDVRIQLRIQLVELRTHLNWWLDKYSGWMKDETRSLVYLADEKDHGPEFPKHLDVAVSEALRLLNRGRQG